MVYNEEEKLDFIKNLSVSENEKQKYKKIEAVFYLSEVGGLEREIKKDLADFKKEEAVLLFSKNEVLRKLTGANWRKALLIFADYTDWESNKIKKEKENIYRDILTTRSVTSFSKLVRDTSKGKGEMKLFSPLELKRLKRLMNPRDYFAVYSQWLGFTEDETLLARMEDLDETSGIMKLYKKAAKGREFVREVKIPKDYIQVCKVANEFTMLNAENPLTRTSISGEEIYKRRSKTILTELTEEQFKQIVFRLRGQIRDEFKRIGVVYNFQWIRTSGLIYQVKILAAEEGLSFKKAIETDKGKEIAKIFGGLEDADARYHFTKYYEKYLV